MPCGYFRDLLGIELPIIQAPMAGVQASDLAIAVSGAGGLGSLPCAHARRPRDPPGIDAITAATTRRTTSTSSVTNRPRPMPPASHGVPRGLPRYYRELDLDRTSLHPPAPSRAPFDEAAAAAAGGVQAARRELSLRLAADDRCARRRRHAARACCRRATTVDEARWLELAGVDAIIAQGVEAGGHRGMLPDRSISRLRSGRSRWCRRSLTPVSVPVIAAGGIADARGRCAALALGRRWPCRSAPAYLLCPEATTSALRSRDAAVDRARDIRRSPTCSPAGPPAASSTA